MSKAVLERAATAGPLIPVDIGHDTYAALTDPNTAFWALVDKTRIAESLSSGSMVKSFRERLTNSPANCTRCVSN